MSQPAHNIDVAVSSTALTPIERAKVAINSAEHEKKLAELAKVSVSITAITNTAGYEQCHSARMALKKVRIDIERIGKGAREDAQAFSKACIAEQNRLIGIIEPEEARLERIQREWDDARKREKEAKEAAERQRVAAINERIDWIRQQALDAAGESAAAIEERIQTLVALPIDGTFAELEKQAEGARATTLIRLRAAHTKAIALEEEQKQLAQERAENERIRQENEAKAAVERARIAEEERIAREARELHASRMSEIHGIQQQVIIAQMGRLGVRKGGTIECIRETLSETQFWTVTEEKFGPLTMLAKKAQEDAIAAIRELLHAAEAKAAEAAEAERVRLQNEAAAEAERQRIAEANAAIQARIEAQEAREQRIADAQAQLARDQEALRVEREKPAPQEATLLTFSEPTVSMPVSVMESLQPVPEVLATDGLLVAESPEPQFASIAFAEWLRMQSVCQAARVWAEFQHPDSKAAQRTDKKLAARAREAVNTLLIAVEQLLPSGAA